MKRLSLLLLTLVIAVSALILPVAGCAGETQTVTLTDTATITKTVESVATSTVTKTLESVRIIDDLGRKVTIEGEPKRIVSLAPSNTELLFALGLGDRVCGVTEWCNYPEEAIEVEKVGGYTDVDLEKIVSLNPDLILAEDMHKYEVIPALENLGFTVVALVPHNLQEVMDSITLLGSLTGAEDKATEILDDMQQRIKAITDITSQLSEEEKVKVLYVIWHDPIMSVGTDTRIHELIELAGGVNIAAVAGEGYPTLALEEVVYANPQVIIANIESYEGGDVSLQYILDESRLSGIDALENGSVYGINADLSNRPTPRIVEALEIIAQMIHPEIFGSYEQ